MVAGWFFVSNSSVISIASTVVAGESSFAIIFFFVIGGAHSTHFPFSFFFYMSICFSLPFSLRAVALVLIGVCDGTPVEASTASNKVSFGEGSSTIGTS